MDSVRVTATKSLMSARPKPTPKKIRGFLGLPGELRNHVYRYYFEAVFCVEFAAKGVIFDKPRPKTVKLCLNLVALGYRDENNLCAEYLQRDIRQRNIRQPRLLGHYTRVNGIFTDWFNSLSALLLVCKQVHRETVRLLYQNTRFAFQAPKRIRNFLNHVSNTNLSYITKLDLHYDNYGEPYEARDRQWVTKHVNSWTSACRAASKALLGLRELNCRIQDNSSNSIFSLRQDYLQPLLQFRRLSRRKRNTQDSIVNDPDNNPEGQPSCLSTVNVHFRTQASRRYLLRRPRELKDASLELHDLFGAAISRAILGWTEEDAMADLRAAWGKHKEWHHHLRYLETNW